MRYVVTHYKPRGARSGNDRSNYAGWDRNSNGRGDVPDCASDLMNWHSWRFPIAKLLLDSPAVPTLRLISEQSPLLHLPSVVDASPSMPPRE